MERAQTSALIHRVAPQLKIGFDLKRRHLHNFGPGRGPETPQRSSGPDFDPADPGSSPAGGFSAPPPVALLRWLRGVTPGFDPADPGSSPAGGVSFASPCDLPATPLSCGPPTFRWGHGSCTRCQHMVHAVHQIPWWKLYIPQESE